MADPTSDDYYRVLGVPRTANDSQLKKAYRKLAMKYHPDKNPDDKRSEEYFKAVSEAYDCLMDPQNRAAYDNYGKDGARAQEQGQGVPGGFSGGGFPGGGQHMDARRAEEMFSMFFGGGGGGGDPFESMFSGGGMPGGMRVQMGPGGGPQVFSSFGGGAPRRRRPAVRYDVLAPGAKVVLKDLVAKPDLNSELASVEAYDDAKQRYQVRLDDDGDVLSLKPQNLQQVLRNVRLTAITSSPELDGESGTLLGARRGPQGDERYVVALSSGKQTVAVKSENMILPKGAVVRVVGTSRSELNGKCATVQSWDGAARRYTVQTPAANQLKLKLANVELV